MIVLGCLARMEEANALSERRKNVRLGISRVLDGFFFNFLFV